MKVLKNGKQRNAMVDTEMYNNNDLLNMEYQGYIFKIDENDVYRVGLNYGDEIKVEYNKEQEFYNTVVIKTDGTKIYVTL